MGRIKRSTNETTVKFLINTVAALTVCFACSMSLATPADDAAAAAARAAAAASGNCYALTPQASIDACLAAKETERVQARCDAKAKEANDAYKEVQTACAEGGFEANCAQEAAACETIERERPADASSGPDYMTSVNQILKAAGISAGSTGVTSSTDGDNPTPRGTNTCSEYNSDDYNARRKEIREDLKDLRKDLTDMQKDLSTQEKDAKKEIADIQDDVTKEKEQLEKDKASMDDDLRKQVSDFMQTQNDIKNQLRQKTLEVLDLRRKLATAQQNQTSKLLQLNDAAIQASCTKQAQESYAVFQKVASAGSMSFQARRSQKQTIMNQYTDCMKLLEQQRIALVADSRAEQQSIVTQITQVQAETGDIQASIDSAQSQLAEIQTQNKDQKAKMDQNLLTKMQTATTKMQTAQSNFQQQQSIATAKQEQINKEINQKQNELAELGVPPRGGAKTAQSAVKARIQANIGPITDYTDACCGRKTTGSSTGTNTTTKLCTDYNAIVKVINGGTSSSSSTNSTKPSGTSQ